MSNSSVVASLPEEKRAEIIRDVYKKQAAELLAIEEAQTKLVMLILGVLGAGASFLGSSQAPMLHWTGRMGLTAVVVALLVIGGLYTDQRNKARASVRAILVRCEEALGMYESGLFLTGPLLDPGYRQYSSSGAWLGWTFFFAMVAGAGFLFVLWAR